MELTDYQKGAVGKGGEVKEWSYWSTTILAAATLTHNLFTVATGGTFEGTVQTLDLTNMLVGGSIPQAQHFTVRAMKVMYASSAAKGTAAVQDLYQLLNRTTVEILFPSKPMGQWTLQELMGSATMFAVTPTAAGDNIPVMQPRYHGIFPLNAPLVLPALQNFFLRVTHNAAHAATLNGDFLKISLAGILVIGS